ncbi:hypothetical protein ACP70R_016371 [Stipagrostis hirtigluma subsp. patula]
MDMKVSSPSAGSKKRPPSRLQKRAPASLQLEQGAAGAGPGPAAGPAAWRDGGAPIPLLSPLVMSPAVPVWEADQAGARRAADGPAVPEGGGGGGGGDQGGAGEQQPRGAARHGGSGERQSPSHDSPKSPVFAPAPTPASTPVQGAGAGAGWFHPALPTPVAEPASLVPLFKSQCAVEVRNAQQ